jgi:hypothetical protein
MEDESKDTATGEGSRAEASEPRAHEPHRVRLPGFLIDEGEEVGAGDAIKRLTYKMGIKHGCAGCDRRAAALNRWVRFTR